MKILKFISSILSALIHPFFIPTIALFILFGLNTHISFTLTPSAKQYILFLVFFNTAVAPMASIYLLKKTRVISSLSLREKKYRLVPLITGTAFYILNYFLLLRVGLHPILNFYLAGATIIVLISLVITLRWKISIHMISMGSATGFFFSLGLILPVDISTLLATSFILSGLLGSARLILKTHLLWQVIAGYIVGFATIMLLFLYASS